MPYDQKSVLASNKLYLCRSLDLQDIDVRILKRRESVEYVSLRIYDILYMFVSLQFYYVSEEIPNGDAKKMETASPGKPAIYAYAQ